MSSDAVSPTTPMRWCRRHAMMLPLHCFAKDDLQNNRRRCKRCVADKVARWRSKNAFHTLWRRFIQRARSRFGREKVDELTWEGVGRELVPQLVSQAESGVGEGEGVEESGDYILQKYILTWPKQAMELNRNQLGLRSKL